MRYDGKLHDGQQGFWQKNADTGQKKFYWRPPGSSERDSIFVPLQILLFFDAMVARKSDANGSLDERLFPTQDANFNVTAVTDPAGSIMERYLYDHYGRKSVMAPYFAPDADNASDSGNRYGFQGGQSDRVLTNQILFGYRLLDVETMRWLTEDLIGFADGLNIYAFTRCSPTNFIDADGLAAASQPVRPTYRDLTWNDFSGPVPADTGGYGATTFSQPTWTNGTIATSVRVSPDQSKCNGEVAVTRVTTTPDGKVVREPVVFPADGYQCYEGTATIKDSWHVYAVFIPEKSWVKPEGKGDAALLRHEQGHFRLSEAVAKSYQAKINALPAKVAYACSERNAKNKAHSALAESVTGLLNEMFATLETEQTRYDAVTNHGLLPDQQKLFDQLLGNPKFPVSPSMPTTNPTHQ